MSNQYDWWVGGETYTAHTRTKPHTPTYHREVKRGVGRNHTAGPAGPIPKRSRNDDVALLPNLHLEHGLVPPSNHLPDPGAERQRLPAVVRGVKLLGALEGIQPPRVVDVDGLAWGVRWGGGLVVWGGGGGREREAHVRTRARDRASPFLDDLVLEAGGGGLKAVLGTGRACGVGKWVGVVGGGWLKWMTKSGTLQRTTARGKEGHAAQQAAEGGGTQVLAAGDQALHQGGGLTLQDGLGGGE